MQLIIFFSSIYLQYCFEISIFSLCLGVLVAELLQIRVFSPARLKIPVCNYTLPVGLSNKFLICGIYSGCQKNVPVFKRCFSTTTYTAIPYFGTSEHYYGKRYKMKTNRKQVIFITGLSFSDFLIITFNLRSSRRSLKNILDTDGRFIINYNVPRFVALTF